MTPPEVQSAHADDRLWSLTAALCDGSISAEDLEQLEAMLRDDEGARLFFAAYMDLHGRLLWRFRSGGQDEGRGARGERPRIAGTQRLEHEECFADSLPTPESAFSPEVGSAVKLPYRLEGGLPHSNLSPPPSPFSSPFVGGPVFSYMAATLIVGMMLLGAWVYKVSHYRQIVGATSPTSTEDVVQNHPDLIFVGRVTGMKDCRWSDPRTATFPGSSVPMGRKYALASGLMEITYDSGAHVILEGPCTYAVESRAGGYLTRGKLTAKVEKSEGPAASAASAQSKAANS